MSMETLENPSSENVPTEIGIRCSKEEDPLVHGSDIHNMRTPMTSESSKEESAIRNMSLQAIQKHFTETLFIIIC